MTTARWLTGRRDPLSDPAALIRRVHGYVAYRMGDCADADDVTSETFARALRYKDSYDPSKGAPIGWLIGIARHCVDESYRGPSVEFDPGERVAQGDMAEETIERLALEAAVLRLDERDRELIALRYGADLSTREIAKRLDMTSNAVDIALHRARGRLRIRLEAAPVTVRQPRERNAGVLR